MVSAIFTLAAVFLGVTSLTAFGFDWWEIVKILVPVGLAVAFFSWLIFWLGRRSARWLNREDEPADEPLQRR